jgi:hypothetical protein
MTRVGEFCLPSGPRASPSALRVADQTQNRFQYDLPSKTRTSHWYALTY